MLSVEKLNEFGANTNEALERCMNNEGFYIMLVEKALKDDSLERLDSALKSGNLDEGFEIAHSLKGVLGNLSLTPLYEVIVEITELLRSRTQTDYSPYMEKAFSIKNRLIELSE
ncbi:MAG: Hpt domain-containing protein [Ruminococcaceae bacterium]|nr:Hpt domain-containing protein [Oscillospiraceae bacterium]